METATVNGSREKSTNVVTIAQVAAKPGHEITPKEFRIVKTYARAMQNVRDLRAKQDYYINEAAKLEEEIKSAELDAKVLGETIYEG